MRLSYREYDNAVISANSNPFAVALFTGGAADIFRAYVSGADFKNIQDNLCNQFPESKEDIANDVTDVLSFFSILNSEDNSLDEQSGQRIVGTMPIIN